MPSLQSKNKPRKTKPTLALSPDEFEKENLKVERDAYRLEVAKLSSDKKDLSDTVDILTTRCRLLEDERNKAATEKAAPKAIPKAGHDTPTHAPKGHA